MSDPLLNQLLPEESREVPEQMLPSTANRSQLELSIVIPTYNELENIEPLLARIAAALPETAWEAIFVDDDSPDHTTDKVRSIAQADPHVRCLQRIGRRGLSSAVIEGMLASSAPYLGVIDADLQHDETLLPQMLYCLKVEGLDLVIGSRYVSGGGIGAWNLQRARISRIATRLARMVVAADLSDPMSGFFMISRPAFVATVRHLSGQGFKLLVDLFASTPVPYRFKELPFVFRERLHGESKLDSLVVWEYLMLLLEKRLGGYIPARFISFVAVGGSGVVVHFSTLLPMLYVVTFPVAQLIASTIAMTSNFSLNNMLTYRDQRLSGIRFLYGLGSFWLICSLGMVANVGIATAVFSRHYSWWLSGLAGVAVGVVWNYALSSIFTWNSRWHR